MTAPLPTPVPLAMDAPVLAEWHDQHQEALGRMSALANALDRQGWPDVDQACRWLQEVSVPHHQLEESELLPVLLAVGAGALSRRLAADHRKMEILLRAILHGQRNGRVRSPGPHGERARQLLNLVRQHIDTEEHVMLPLLRGLPHPLREQETSEGYLTIYPRA
ncbi:MAG: hemerythrin domain-containing protein [Holophaga sp.]|nr:hemerythrin domain-containing protein [Holophaga sp.]